MKKYCLSINSSIKDSLKRMDKWSVKTLFITDEKNILIGVISAGDIRRAILNEMELSVSIESIINRTPLFFVENSFGIDEVKTAMLSNKIDCIPIVDKNNCLKSVLFWDTVFGEQKEELPQLNASVVIMAGGKGTRMKPFTNILPKPLIPIGDSSMVEVIMDEYKKYGINDFHLTVNFKKKLIKAYFEEEDKDYNISYIEEDIPLGTAGSIKFLEGKLSSTFFVSNCDILIKGQYHKMLEFHKEGNYDLTLIGSVQHIEVPYGVCTIKNGGDLDEIIEKPSYDFLVNTGMYILEPKVLSVIPEGKFYHITHLMSDLKAKGYRVGVFPVSEKSWIDIGQWSELNKVLNHN